MTRSRTSQSVQAYWIAFGIMLSLYSFQSALSQSAKPSDPIIAVVGAEVRTCDAIGNIPNGIVLIQGDAILAVGDSTLSIPEGAKTINAKGKVLTPGLIDAHSKLWLSADSANVTANDASLDMTDGIDPYSENWHEALASGVTSIYMQPASKGSLGGYGSVVSVMPKSDGKVGVLAQKAGLQAAIGVTATSNRTRLQELDRIKKVLDGAIEYRKKWDEYEAYIAKQAKEKEVAKESSTSSTPATKPDSTSTTTPSSTPPVPGSRGRPPGLRPSGPPEVGGRPAGPPESGATNRPATPPTDTASKSAAESEKGKDKPVIKPEKDPAKEELLRVIKGEIPLRLEVNGPDDVHFAMKLFEQDAFKAIQVVFDGLSDLRSASKVVRDLKNPVVLGPWLDLEQADAESLGSTKRWSSEFASYDGIVAIASNGKGAQSSKLLRAHAAKAVSLGFNPERALKAITIDAAKALGVGDRIGSIAKGKRADLVCLRGEPTNTASQTIWVMSGGIVVDTKTTPTVDDEKQTNLFRLTEKPVDLPAPLPRCYYLKSSRCWLEARLQPALLGVCDGKIVSVLKDSSQAPLDHPTFDLLDAVVTPGLVSGHANFGSGRVIDPQQEPDASLVVAADGLPKDFNGEMKLVESGLLRALLAPGSSNPISGSVSLIRIGAQQPEYARDAGAKFVLSSSGRNPNRFPSSLAGQIQLVSQSLKGTLLPSRVYVPASIEQNLRDRRATNLKEVASGKTVAIIEAQTDAEIQSALQLIEKQNLKAFLLGPKQLKSHIDRILESKSTIVVQPITSTEYAWYIEDIVRATKAGIPICFEGESAEQLRLTASMIVAAGADHNRVLSSLCEIPAAIAGSLSSAVKSGLEKDAPADLVIWSSSPVDMQAKPLHVLIDGQVASKKNN